jgi:CheY-like chemotaxis protein
MSSVPVHDVQVRVLVVEDHVALANRIGEGLRDAGMAVDVVYDGAAALLSTVSADYDVVVLDRDRRPYTAIASAANSCAPDRPAAS